MSNRKSNGLVRRPPFACAAAATVVGAGLFLAAGLVGCTGLDGAKWNFGDRSATESAAADGLAVNGKKVRKKDGPPRTQEAISELETRRNEAQFLAAETSWRQGDEKRCREALEKVLARDPVHRGSILLLADVHLEGDRSAEAVEVLERGVAACPADAEIAYKFGVALEADGQAGQSLHWLHQAAGKEPANEKYRSALAQARDDAAAKEQVAAQARAEARTASVSERFDPAAKPQAALNTPPQAALISEPQATSIAAIDAPGLLPPPVPPLKLASHSAPAPQPAPAQQSSRAAQSTSVPGAAPTVAPHEIDEPAPTRSDAEFQAALADWDAGRKLVCEAKLVQLLSADPKHADAAILLAEVELASGRQAEARARVEQLVIRHPHDPQVRRACGLIYEALGQTELAASCFAKAEQLAAMPPATTATHRDAVARDTVARDTVAREGRAPAQLNLAVLETTPDDASKQLRQTAAEEPGLPSDPNSPRDTSEPSPASPPAPSVLRFESDTKSSPLPPPAASSAAPAPLAPGDRGKPTAAELLDRGTTALAQGNVESARNAFTEAIRLDPKNSQTAVTAAVAALKHEQPELALQLATKGLESLPRSAGLHRIHGTAAYKLGRFVAAEVALRQSLSLDNSQALSYFLLGSVQSRLGKNEAAEGQFRQAAKLDRRYAVRR